MFNAKTVKDPRRMSSEDIMLMRVSEREDCEHYPECSLTSAKTRGVKFVGCKTPDGFVGCRNCPRYSHEERPKASAWQRVAGLEW